LKLEIKQLEMKWWYILSFIIPITFIIIGLILMVVDNVDDGVTNYGGLSNGFLVAGVITGIPWMILTSIYIRISLIKLAAKSFS
jgi:hypothetical protein